MANKKHYIITSITLGIIAASSALLIGLTHALTIDQINKNEANRVNEGIHKIYGDSAYIFKDETAKEAGLEGKYLNFVYTVKNDMDEQLGYAFRTTGSNTYGKISLIIGFDEISHGFKGLSVVVNEQTYASTLVKNYIDPLNDGDINPDDVSCGATYGATLINNMIKQANDAALKLWGIGNE